MRGLGQLCLPSYHNLEIVNACVAANLLRRAAISASEKRHTAAGRRWLRSYLNGCAFKIFDAPLPAHLAGLPFTAACEWLYRTAGCMLIGARRMLGRRQCLALLELPTSALCSARDPVVSNLWDTSGLSCIWTCLCLP